MFNCRDSVIVISWIDGVGLSKSYRKDKFWLDLQSSWAGWFELPKTLHALIKGKILIN